MNLVKLTLCVVFSSASLLPVDSIAANMDKKYVAELPVEISPILSDCKLKPVSNLPTATGTVITDPAGVTTIYSRSSIAIAPFGDIPKETYDYGFAGVIVTGENGEVYLQNPFSQYPTGTYLKGTIEGDRMTFTLPQNFAIIEDEEEDEAFELYACMLELSADGMRMELSADQTLTFVKDGSSWVMTGTALLGLTLDDYLWSGFGEREMRFDQLDAVTATMPDNVATEDWALIYNGIGHNVEVAFDGDKCYINNFFVTESGASFAPIVGSKTDSGLIFRSGQYLGINEDDSYLIYFHGGEVESVYNEEIDAYVTAFIPGDDMVFTKDGDGSYSSASSALFTPFTDLGNEYFWYEDMYETPSLRKNDIVDFTPATPSISAYRYYDSMGFGYVTFDIPALNIAGMLLDTKNMYYNIYIDGDKFTLHPDDYHLLDEEITDIPYDFTDANGGMSGDITVDGQKHTFILFEPGIESVGVQSYYVDDNDNTYYSQLVSNKVTSIDDTDVDVSPVVEERYTDIMGRQVTQPGTGLYIKTIVRADGSITSIKIAR